VLFDVPAGSKKQILVIDDDPDILQMIELLLKKENYIAATAKDAQCGLSRLSEETFDLLILDLNMPGMTGQQMICEMARRRIRIPILIITAQANPGLTFKDLLKKYPKLDLLPKPFLPTELIEKVEKYVQS